MRAELTVAYDSNADLRDRIHSLQQQAAAIRAEAAARTPVGVTIEKVRHQGCIAISDCHGTVAVCYSTCCREHRRRPQFP